MNARALQYKVDKMLEKKCLGVVNHPGPGFYSRFSRCRRQHWKEGGGGGDVSRHQLVELNGYITLTKVTMQMVSLVLGQSGRGTSGSRSTS